MAGAKRVGIVLLIFLGPGLMILFIAKTCENHFIKLPYLGWEYTYDSAGNKVDSTKHVVPDFTLTRFDGVPITRDSIEGKFIILSTLQNGCPNITECGMGIYVFNELMFQKIVDNQGPDRYGNVKVLSILTDANGNPDSVVSPLLREQMAQYNDQIWWMCTGDPVPLFSFNYYGDNFMNHPSSSKEGEIGNKAFVNSLVLIDDKGHIRGVSGAKTDTDIRNFFDMLKLLKKEEFKANQERNKH
jgi:hypothetical protein